MIRDWLSRARSRGSDDREYAQMRTLPLEQIEPSPYQPRRLFGEQQLAELADSIRHMGVIEPIIVRPVDDGYQLIVGERRLRAAKIAGLEEIPAVVRDVDDQNMALLGLTENLQREDLHFIEEAEAYREIIDKFQLTQKELAEQLGLKQSTVSNKLRLLALDSRLRELLRQSDLGERHARALLRLPDTDTQIKVLERAMTESLSVRQLEELITKVISGDEDPEGKTQRVRGVIRDMRIYLNALNETVKTMRDSGMSVKMDQEDLGDRYKIVIRIDKNKGAKSDAERESEE